MSGKKCTTQYSSFTVVFDENGHLCYFLGSERTGETCEASGPEGPCGGLSLFMELQTVFPFEMDGLD